MHVEYKGGLIDSGSTAYKNFYVVGDWKGLDKHLAETRQRAKDLIDHYDRMQAKKENSQPVPTK